MRILLNPSHTLNFRKPCDDVKQVIENKSLPLLESTESLYFEEKDGTLYVIETEQDLEEIQTLRLEENLIGEWKISNAALPQNENSALMPLAQNKSSLPQKDIVINILKITLPITGVVALTVTTNYVTSIFLGNYNTQLLAAMTIIEALESPLSNVCQFTLYPLSPLIGQFKETSPKTVGKIMQQGYLVGLGATIPSLLIRYFSKSILLGLNQSPLLVGHAESFFHASMWGMPATILINADEQLLLASGNKSLYVFTSFTDLGITLGLSYVLMYGKLGFPEVGIASLGYAIAARSWFSFILYKAYFLAKSEFKPYQLFHCSFKNVFSDLSTFLKIALPVSFQIVSKSSFMFAVNMMLGGRYGVSTLVAMQVIFRYLPMVSLPVQALALATSIEIGTTLGLGDIESISRYGNTGIILGLCHTSLLFVLTALMPTVLAQPFINVDDPQHAKTIALLRPFFMILFGGQILESMDVISVAALRGLMDTAAPMLLGIVTTWLVAFPLVYVMVNNFSADATLAAMMAGLVISSAINVGRWTIQSSPKEIEQSMHSEQSDVLENNIPVLSTCLNFFKPQRYNMQAKPISTEPKEGIDEDFIVVISEEEEDPLKAFEISEEENTRCQCTLF